MFMAGVLKRTVFQLLRDNLTAASDIANEYHQKKPHKEEEKV